MTLSAEYARVGEDLAWSAMAGVATNELIPPDEFEPAIGGGAAWTGFHRAACPAITFRAGTRPPGDEHRTLVHIGLGAGRRLGKDRIRGGFALRGERFWGMAVLGLQVAGYSPGEDVMDGSVRFASGVAF